MKIESNKRLLLVVGILCRISFTEISAFATYPYQSISRPRTFLKSDSSTTESDRLRSGWLDLRNGRAFNPDKISNLATVEDVIGVGANIPLVFESLRTALTGELDPQGCLLCVAVSCMTAWSHGKMTGDTPRDWRAPRLAEYRTIYEFSALYLVPFSWLLWRVSLQFPEPLEVLDIPMCLLLTLISVYGVIIAIYGKVALKQANHAEASDPESPPSYTGPLLPSSKEYQAQAQLYLTGGYAINILAWLFIPFAWTLAIRGTDWWVRVCELHPHQAAFLGLSILVAILGDVTGNLLLRLEELDLVQSTSAIVVVGLISNVLFLLVPEIVFNVQYYGGISEIGFYWE